MKNIQQRSTNMPQSTLIHSQGIKKKVFKSKCSFSDTHSVGLAELWIQHQRLFQIDHSCHWVYGEILWDLRVYVHWEGVPDFIVGTL